MVKEVKAPKYSFEGQGFSNKREYMNAIAISHFSAEGKEKLVSVMNDAINNITEKLGHDIEKASKMLHIGFRNTQQSKLNQDLQKTADSLTEKGYVELVIFSFAEGGRPIANAREVLLRKHFNDKGLLIVGDNMLDANEEVPSLNNKPAEYTGNTTSQSHEGQVELIISEDIDTED